MTEPSQSSDEAILRSFAVYQDAVVRIADIVRQMNPAETVAEPVRDICYRAHQEVAVIFGSAQAQPEPDGPNSQATA